MSKMWIPNSRKKKNSDGMQVLYVPYNPLEQGYRLFLSRVVLLVPLHSYVLMTPSQLILT